MSVGVIQRRTKSELGTGLGACALTQVRFLRTCKLQFAAYFACNDAM